MIQGTLCIHFTKYEGEMKSIWHFRMIYNKGHECDKDTDNIDKLDDDDDDKTELKKEIPLDDDGDDIHTWYYYYYF